jgi:tRNA(His) 5'-end guanylyltransferase
MKSYYEDRYRINLPRRTNILLRIDGKAFHSYTKGLKRPFDTGLSDQLSLASVWLLHVNPVYARAIREIMVLHSHIFG